MKTRLICLWTILTGFIFLSVGCGKSGTKPATTGKPNNATYSASVDISNFTFSPASVTVLTGGVVTWTNKDAVDHTATDLGGNFDSGHINPSQTFKFTFTKAGTYTYHCAIHSMMPNATVVVVAGN
ncbi:MAG TPA: plastocyanin/azurin family copper-binding protein [Mucilaginibacter sp.]|nr:plastocyanin/azurin family copper-binding protein [Mucilaginibacter sp.]